MLPFSSQVLLTTWRVVQVQRQNDIYVFCCSFEHNVAAKGKWLAFVSTTVETQRPEQELLPGEPACCPAAVCLHGAQVAAEVATEQLHSKPAAARAAAT